MTAPGDSFFDREGAAALTPLMGCAVVARGAAGVRVGALRVLWLVLVVGLVVLVVGLLGGVASARSQVGGASVRAASKAPLRAVFYSAVPARS
ncbi:MAG: hypothetical protein QOK36_683, partial [Gaiellales bacterium]|nr:hypothetical protein [Gaiellales bacterium]